MTMKQLADENYWVAESDQPTYESMWDAEQIYGCRCGEGWYGYDCSVPSCPLGDDPISTGQGNEIQLLYCFATSGTFKLRFGDAITRDIDASRLTATSLEYELEKIDSITDVSVSLSSGKKVCRTDEDVVAVVEFNQEFGPGYHLQMDLGVTAHGPLRVEDSTLDGTVTVKWGGETFLGYDSQASEKENSPCADRGWCSSAEGTCECYFYPLPRFRSSDGNGNAGVRGDCGSMDPIDDGEVTECTGEITCNTRGACNEDSYRCECEEGWMGGDCSERTCPKGKAWFDFPRADEEAHTAVVECSARGLCDRSSGECECADNFYGAACEHLACPNDCNGNGQCMSVRELAGKISEGEWVYGAALNSPATWDADRVHGCLCDEGYWGHDCARRTCPHGDDPGSYGQAKETQLVECHAGGGAFTLTYQSSFYTTKTTEGIPANSSALEVAAALEKLSNLDDVEVAFSSGPSACRPEAIGQEVVSITTLPYPTHVDKEFEVWVNVSAGPLTRNGLKVQVLPSGGLLADQAAFRSSSSGDIETKPEIKGINEMFDISNNETIVFQDYYDTSRKLTVVPTTKGRVELTFVLWGAEAYHYRHESYLAQGANLTLNSTAYAAATVEPPRMDSFIVDDATPFDITLGELPTGSKNITVKVEAVKAVGRLSFSNDELIWTADSDYTQTFYADTTGGGADSYNVSFSIAYQSPGLSYVLQTARRVITATSGTAAHTVRPPASYGELPVHETSPALAFRLSTPAPNGLTLTPRAEGGVTFDPAVLTFAAGTDTAYTSITSGDKAGTFAVNYTLGGTDAAEYAVPSDDSITISDVNVMSITFLSENGNIRSLTTNEDGLKDTALGVGKLYVFTDGESTRGQTSVNGTTEYIECSGRGVCNYDSGLCECYTGYRSSNGNGKPGAKGECGYRIAW